MNSFTDYYALLYVTPNADEELIKRAYRIQSKKVHPDQGGNSQKFILLTQAYQTLIDPYKRKVYDQEYYSYMSSKAKENDRKNYEDPNKSQQEGNTSSNSEATHNAKGNQQSNSSSKTMNSKRTNSSKERLSKSQITLSYAITILIGVSIHYFLTDIHDQPQEKYSYQQISNDSYSNLPSQTGEEESIPDVASIYDEEIEDEQQENNVEDIRYRDHANLYFEIYKDVQPDSEIYKRYYTRLRDMEIDMKEHYPSIWQYGTYGEQAFHAQAYLVEWDNMLNEIYGIVRNSLSPEEFNSLRELQIDWISYRDHSALIATESFKGGLQEEAIYYDSLLESTRERCYWLITNYLN